MMAAMAPPSSLASGLRPEQLSKATAREKSHPPPPLHAGVSLPLPAAVAFRNMTI